MRRQLSDWIEGYLEYNSDSEAPKAYLKWSALATIAAAAQRRCWITRGMYNTYPNLYTFLVGPPSVGKGIAMRLGIQLLSDIGLPTMPESSSRRGLLNTFDDASEDVDINGETYTHTSVSLFAPEIETFFSKNDPEMMSNLVNIFDSGDEVKDITDKHGLKIYKNIWFNILGGITQETLGHLIEKNIIGSGFSSRVLMVYANAKYQYQAFPRVTEKQQRIKEALREDLEQMLLLKGEIKKTNDYIERFTEWYDYNVQPENYPIRDPRFAYYCDRRCSLHLPKLVVLAVLSEGNSMTAEVRHFDKALSFLEEIEPTMPNALSSAGLLGHAAQVLHEIRSTVAYKGEIRYSHLLMQYSHSLHEYELWNLIMTIERIGECRLEPRMPKDRSRWPSELRTMTTVSEIKNFLRKDNYRYRGEASDWMIISTKKKEKDNEQR